MKAKIKAFSIEGGDGAGKTTLLNKINDFLKQKNIDFVITREPGGNNIAEKIREIVLDKENSTMDARTEALLYAASRAQHLHEKVIPLIEEGKLVIFDRFIDSSLAYQGKARNLGIDEVFQMNQFATNGFLPDFTIYIDIDPEIARKRTLKRSNLDRLESEDITFHKEVREGYREVAKMFRDRILIVDGNQKSEDIFKIVSKILIKKLGI